MIDGTKALNITGTLAASTQMTLKGGRATVE